ncbi:polysaccharide pyruvyl transferase family protein [Streptomyces sp. NPDC047097]|uniref:polysaccharide pyruvyl transferase family protein n=1 Tax=Streptomyces sp. NPDC047097 TaxID=3155260 RepID=UPI00340E9965
MPAPPRALLTGWFAFLHGEVTAGDELALRRVQRALDAAGLAHDTAWSPAFRPGALCLDRVRPEDYTTLLFICGPLHGEQLADLHRRFAHCRRIAVGTSTIDPGAPAATGFHHVLSRGGADGPPLTDLAASAPATGLPPVAGVILTRGQGEYGARRRHDQAATALTHWLAARDIAALTLDTRLALRDPGHFRTPEQLDAVLTRLDAVVTTRLHGLVLALRAGIPALAVDPVAGGAKVTAQAAACDWPALLPADRLDPAALDHWWHWCLTTGRAEARSRHRFRHHPDDRLTGPLLRLLHGPSAE